MTRLVSLVIVLAAVAASPRASGASPDAGVAESHLVDKAVRASAFAFNEGRKPGSEGWCRTLQTAEGRCAGLSRPVRLDKRQLAELKAILSSREALEADAPPCHFNPHHGVELYDGRGRRLGEVDVCFECEIVEVTPADPARSGALTELGMTRLRALFSALGLKGHLNPPEAEGAAGVGVTLPLGSDQ